MSKYESTNYLCTLFDIQYCQSVIRKLVYGFMCRLDSSVNYIIQGNQLPVCGIHPGYVNTGVVYYILIVDRTNYTIHIVYNLLHVMLDDNYIYGPQIVMYVLLVYIWCCWVWNKAIELNWIDTLLRTIEGRPEWKQGRGRPRRTWVDAWNDTTR